LERSLEKHVCRGSNGLVCLPVLRSYISTAPRARASPLSLLARTRPTQHEPRFCNLSLLDDVFTKRPAMPAGTSLQHYRV